MQDLTTPRLRRIERRVEEQLRELAEMGELSRLPGEGAPLVLDDADGDSWAARRVARNANCVPHWIELRREIEERRARLERRLHFHREWLEDRAAQLRDLPADRLLDFVRATRGRDARVQKEVAASVEELNALVARHNLSVPLSLQLAPLAVERPRDT